ncbi:hypothetical protein J3F83DRAFT_261488 [Trichoderma novae-zelandiae]
MCVLLELHPLLLLRALGSTHARTHARTHALVRPLPVLLAVKGRRSLYVSGTNSTSRMRQKSRFLYVHFISVHFRVSIGRGTRVFLASDFDDHICIFLPLSPHCVGVPGTDPQVSVLLPPFSFLYFASPRKAYGACGALQSAWSCPACASPPPCWPLCRSLSACSPYPPLLWFGLVWSVGTQTACCHLSPAIDSYKQVFPYCEFFIIAASIARPSNYEVPHSRGTSTHTPPRRSRAELATPP